MQNYSIITDETGRELVDHGDEWFPLAGYDELFSKFVLKEVSWHWHEEIEIVYIVKGSSLVELVGQHITLKAGEGIFINSNEPHKMTQIGDVDCRIINFVFKPEFIGGRLDSKIHRQYLLPICTNDSFSALKLSPSIQWQNLALEEIKQAFDIYTYKVFGYEMILRSRLTTFWILLCQHKQDLLLNQTSPNEDDIRIKTIITYIHNHYMSKLTVDQLAKSANISESECFRLFKRMLQTTPMAYILKLRLQLSTKRLIESDTNILDLSIELGFASPSYFSKQFKRQYAITPREFRVLHS